MAVKTVPRGRKDITSSKNQAWARPPLKMEIRSCLKQTNKHKTRQLKTIPNFWFFRQESVIWRGSVGTSTDVNWDLERDPSPKRSVTRPANGPSLRLPFQEVSRWTVFLAAWRWLLRATILRKRGKKEMKAPLFQTTLKNTNRTA